jgi:uncharacterized protein
MRFRLGCLVLMLVAVPGEASELPDYPFIFVTGHATQSVVPDVAKVSLTVRARNASSAAATEIVGARSQQVLDLLLANQIASTDIDAHDVNKTTIFEPDSNGASGTARGPQVVRYDVSRSFTFLVHELGSWPQLGTKLLQMDNVEGIDCRFDRSDHKGIQSELTAAAAQDAKQHAESMAAAFGQHLGPVQAISPESLRELSYKFLDSPSFAGGLGGPRDIGPPGSRKSVIRLLVPATIQFEVDLNALYRLGDR